MQATAELFPGQIIWLGNILVVVGSLQDISKREEFIQARNSHLKQPAYVQLPGRSVFCATGTGKATTVLLE